MVLNEKSSFVIGKFADVNVYAERMVREQFHLLSMGELMLLMVEKEVKKMKIMTLSRKKESTHAWMEEKRERRNFSSSFFCTSKKNENFKQTTHWCWKRLSRVALRKCWDGRSFGNLKCFRWENNTIAVHAYRRWLPINCDLLHSTSTWQSQDGREFLASHPFLRWGGCGENKRQNCEWEEKLHSVKEIKKLILKSSLKANFLGDIHSVITCHVVAVVVVWKQANLRPFPSLIMRCYYYCFQ